MAHRDDGGNTIELEEAVPPKDTWDVDGVQGFGKSRDGPLFGLHGS